MKSSIKLAFIMLALLFVTAPLAWADAVPNPLVTGPIPVNAAPGDPSHDYVFFTPEFDLAEYGYVEEEFFIEGQANRYNTPTGADGTIISSGHPYRTRIVVRRPLHNKRYNGVVLLEWQNVTAGYELDAHWAPSWEHIIRAGYAWVGVSAQRVGVHGGSGTGQPLPPGTPNYGLKAWSPTRYGTLDLTEGGTITDDSICYDVYSQAAQAIRKPQGVDPMDGLKTRQIIAVGASQSAGRLSIYHNSIHPLHNAVDGYYLLVGGAGLRTDLTVKVMQYLSETDLRTGPARRMADSDHFRSWEVAGTAHSSYVSDVYRSPLVLRDFGTEVWPPECDLPPYSRVRGYDVINAQYDHLVRWIKCDKAPPTAPKIEFSAATPPVMVRDELGLVKGGIRLPDVAVPIALNTGINSGATFCVLYGTYQPFDAALLRELYPNHGKYVKAVTQSANKNVKAGYILKEAANEIIVDAAMSDVPPK
jgi:hypothetical protein